MVQGTISIKINKTQFQEVRHVTKCLWIQWYEVFCRFGTLNVQTMMQIKYYNVALNLLMQFNGRKRIFLNSLWIYYHLRELFLKWIFCRCSFNFTRLLGYDSRCSQIMGSQDIRGRLQVETLLDVVPHVIGAGNKFLETSVTTFHTYVYWPSKLELRTHC